MSAVFSTLPELKEQILQLELKTNVKYVNSSITKGFGDDGKELFLMCFHFVYSLHLLEDDCLCASSLS
jgi:hypothetical protein